MDPSRENLDALPLETLQQIAGHLHETHRPSLYAFSSASEQCHQAALPEVFREIRLRVRNCQALQRKVDALIEILTRTDSARHVRCLSIKGFLDLDDDGGSADDATPAMCWHRKISFDGNLPDEEPILASGASHVRSNGPVIARSSEEDMAWAPVVGLVKMLPRLDTLVYSCRNQFPPSLLDALHGYQPQCRLHHLTFHMRTLLSDIPDPYEMALATSPCLHRVKVACGPWDDSGGIDYNGEAAMELAAGLAPNVKEVAMAVLCRKRTWINHRPRAPWRGLPGSVPGAGIGSLTSLSLYSQVEWSPDLLLDWAKHIDFGSLRRLALGGGSRHESRVGMKDEMMGWIAQNCSFPRLKALTLHLRRGSVRAERPGYTENATALLRSFEPLEELSVAGPLEPEMLNAILSRHGPTLRKLSLHSIERSYEASNSRHLPMVFGKEQALQIRAQCPALQELDMPVKRTKSDAAEAEIYKILGTMARLRSLFLILDCSEWRVTRDSTYSPPFEGEDDEPTEVLDWLKNGHLRDTFMNCAVDGALARSIWDTISQHKDGVQLQSLKLYTTSGGEFGKYTTHSVHDDVIDHLSRSWLIKRVVGDVIEVREMGRRERKMDDEETTGCFRSDEAQDSYVMRILRRIWPRKEGSRDWRDDWSSLPLQV